MATSEKEKSRKAERPRPKPNGFASLSVDILVIILDYVEADPDKSVRFNRRAYLSQESFRAPPSVSPDALQTIGCFRLVCKRFANEGAIYQYAAVTTRFGQAGLERLDNIARHQHLARHVKKFTYILPEFYLEGRDNVGVLGRAPYVYPEARVAELQRKAREQHFIVSSGYDSEVLHRAFKAFQPDKGTTGLQHVKILRKQDTSDADLLKFLRANPELNEFIALAWDPAVTRATETLVATIRETRSPCAQFTSQFSRTQSARSLTPTLASNLTSLMLQFDNEAELPDDILNLSASFRDVLFAARKLEMIHLGFPAHCPLDLRLEDVFQYVHWERLVSFGIQSWKLDTDEITEFVGRHRQSLRGLRLRLVMLNEGSMWKDVLKWLNGNLQLQWLSLRRICYYKTFEQEMLNRGFEIDDDSPSSSSSSDDESDDRNDDAAAPDAPSIDAVINGQQARETDHVLQPHGSGPSHLTSPPNFLAEAAMDVPALLYEDVPYSDADSDSGPSENSIHGPEGDALEMPLSPEVPPQRSSRDDGYYPMSAEDWGDNGHCVSNAQRKMWEKWVVRQ